MSSTNLPKYCHKANNGFVCTGFGSSGLAASANTADIKVMPDNWDTDKGVTIGLNNTKPVTFNPDGSIYPYQVASESGAKSLSGDAFNNRPNTSVTARIYCIDDQQGCKYKLYN